MKAIFNWRDTIFTLCKTHHEGHALQMPNALTIFLKYIGLVRSFNTHMTSELWGSNLLLDHEVSHFSLRSFHKWTFFLISNYWIPNWMLPSYSPSPVTPVSITWAWLGAPLVEYEHLSVLPDIRAESRLRTSWYTYS